MIQKEKQGKFFEIIRDAISSYALTGYETEGGGKYTLLELIASLYPGDDVGPGQHEMDLIIDEISLALSDGGFLGEKEEKENSGKIGHIIEMVEGFLSQVNMECCHNEEYHKEWHGLIEELNRLHNEVHLSVSNLKDIQREL